MYRYRYGYLLAGDRTPTLKSALKMASDFLGEAEKTLNSNPDFLFLEKSVFAIDDARLIRESSAKKSFGGKGRVFLIVSDSFTTEACNALLKTLEEPIADVLFLVVTSSPENLLVTVRSRLTVLNFSLRGGYLPEEAVHFARNFLGSSPDERKEMAEKIGEESGEVFSFLNGLESILRDFLITDITREAVFSLEQVLKHRRIIADKVSSPKMILEHICLVLPSFNK